MCAATLFGFLLQNRQKLLVFLLVKLFVAELLA